MNDLKALKELADVTEVAKNGVDYSPKIGAICPSCETPRTPVVGSLPWDGDCKIRYHKCKNPDCPFSVLGITIKSIQVDS